MAKTVKLNFCLLSVIKEVLFLGSSGTCQNPLARSLFESQFALA